MNPWAQIVRPIHATARIWDSQPASDQEVTTAFGRVIKLAQSTSVTKSFSGTLALQHHDPALMIYILKLSICSHAALQRSRWRRLRR